MSAAQLSSPRLRALARRPGAPTPAPGEEVCELCGAPVAAEHRHLAEVDTRRLVYDVSATVFFLFLAVVTLTAKKERP